MCDRADCVKGQLSQNWLETWPSKHCLLAASTPMLGNMSPIINWRGGKQGVGQKNKVNITKENKL